MDGDIFPSGLGKVLVVLGAIVAGIVLGFGVFLGWLIF